MRPKSSVGRSAAVDSRVIWPPAKSSVSAETTSPGWIRTTGSMSTSQLRWVGAARVMTCSAMGAGKYGTSYRGGVTTAIRMLRALDRLICRVGGACCVSRSQARSEEHTSELQSQFHLVCRLLLEKKKKNLNSIIYINKKKTKKNNS